MRHLQPKLNMLNRLFVALLLSVGLAILCGVVGNLIHMDEKLVLAIVVLIIVLVCRFWYIADAPR